jgi:CheY-like chemotaxis protein
VPGESGRAIELVVVGGSREAIDYLLGPDGKAAVDHHIPDLVLLDLNLPEMSGREVLERIRATPACCHLPVIMFSSSASARKPGCTPPERMATSESRMTHPALVEVMRNLLRFWLDTATAAQRREASSLRVRFVCWMREAASPHTHRRRTITRMTSRLINFLSGRINYEQRSARPEDLTLDRIRALAA